MAAEDFNDDTKDAGELGAGHAVTAIYEIVLVGQGRHRHRASTRSSTRRPANRGEASD